MESNSYTILKTREYKRETDHKTPANRPFIERYHGLNDKVEVTDGMQKSHHALSPFFGVKFKQTGLEKGRLRIKLEDAPSIYLNANADIHKTVESELKMVSMRNLTANIPTGDNQHLTENVKVEVFWEETPGAEEKRQSSVAVSHSRETIPILSH